jgi:galactokinase
MARDRTQHASDPDIADRLVRATRALTARFAGPPRFAASAPGRVNLIGEHTDYNDGFVLPIALDRRAVIVADRTTASPRSTLLALDLERSAEADFTRPLERDTDQPWANYLLGVADQFRRRGANLPNIELALTSSIPLGAGLSSSAAIEVAMATLLEQMLGVELDPVEKALLCQEAEHIFAGTPCGIMDMFVATMARPGHALLIDCRSHEARPIRMPPTDEAIVLIVDTGIRHELAGGAYAARRATCRQAAARLAVKALRDARIDDLAEAALTQDEHRRATHVILENERTCQAAECLEAGDVARFGELMFQSHESLRYLYEVSCPELDTIVDAARGLRDAGLPLFGARMTGGGFGGSAIVFCPPRAAGTIVDRLRRAFREAHGHEPAALNTGAAGSARTHSIPLD